MNNTYEKAIKAANILFAALTPEELVEVYEGMTGFYFYFSHMVKDRVERIKKEVESN